MKRLGLRFKFILLIAILLSAIFSVISFILIKNNTTTLRNKVATEALAFASLATKPIGDTFIMHKDAGRIRILQQVERFTDLNPDISNVAVSDTQGNILFNQQPNAKVEVTALEASTFDPIIKKDQNGQIEQIIEPLIEDFGLRRYAVIYQVSNASITQATKETVRSIILLSAVALLVSALITYRLISWLFLNPLRSLSQSALSISTGRLDQKIMSKGNDEISDLAKSLNTMAEALVDDIKKLKEGDALKTEFMMIASHNLRTPLTIFNGYLDLLKTIVNDPKATELVNTLEANSQRLSAFAENMLTISRIEGGSKNSISLEPGNICEVLGTVAKEASYLVRDKQLSISANIPPLPINILLNKSQMQVALWNIIDNSIKFSSHGGHISVSLKSRDAAVEILIEDNGIGIFAEELPKLFTKFHRGTPTTSYDYEGTGLGLYITKLIIDAHKGTIGVLSKPGKGTVVKIKLPVYSERHDSSSNRRQDLLLEESKLTKPAITNIKVQ